MSDYNLNEGEFILLQEENVRLRDNDGMGDDPLEEVVLTNESLILVRNVPTGLFKSKRSIMRCPLNHLVCQTGHPHLTIMRRSKRPYLRIPFSDGTIELRLDNESQHHAQSWADNIAHAAQGEFDEVRKDNALVASVMSLPGAEEAAAVANDLFAGMRRAARRKKLSD